MLQLYQLTLTLLFHLNHFIMQLQQLSIQLLPNLPDRMPSSFIHIPANSFNIHTEFNRHFPPKNLFSWLPPDHVGDWHKTFLYREAFITQTNGLIQ